MMFATCSVSNPTWALPYLLDSLATPFISRCSRKSIYKLQSCRGFAMLQKLSARRVFSSVDSFLEALQNQALKLPHHLSNLGISGDMTLVYDIFWHLKLRCSFWQSHFTAQIDLSVRTLSRNANNRLSKKPEEVPAMMISNEKKFTRF